jgi:ribonucleoside-diphosphate reductase alpha chain
MSGKLDSGNAFTTGQMQPETSVEASKSMRLKIEQFFSTPGVHPFEQLEWEIRSAKITGDNGQAIFEQNDIEVPASWSQLATKVDSESRPEGRLLRQARRCRSLL